MLLLTTGLLTPCSWFCDRKQLIRKHYLPLHGQHIIILSLGLIDNTKISNKYCYSKLAKSSISCSTFTFNLALVHYSIFNYQNIILYISFCSNVFYFFIIHCHCCCVEGEKLVQDNCQTLPYKTCKNTYTYILSILFKQHKAIKHVRAIKNIFKGQNDVLPLIDPRYLNHCNSTFLVLFFVQSG